MRGDVTRPEGDSEAITLQPAEFKVNLVKMSNKLCAHL
jgi:hypothetical protein